MTRKAFDKIKAGLEDALEFAKGEHVISMVERMSRAIWSASKPPCLWEEAPDIIQAYWTGIAVAALREMREPTEVMANFLGTYERELFTAAIDAEIAAYEADRASPVLRPPS